MKKPLLVFVGVVVVIGVVLALVLNMASKKSSSTNNSSTTPTTSPAASANTPATAPILIKYTNSGFTPVKVSVKPGTRITIRNDSSNDVQFNSDPHPTHTDNPELNVGSVGKGEDKTFAVTKSGMWGYHNHLNPSEKGSIVVQ